MAATDGKNTAIIRWLLTGGRDFHPSEISSAKEWNRSFIELSQQWDTPADLAAAGGFSADRLAYAFAAGYQSALRRLIPGLPRDAVVSFCVTEEGGGHPRAIESILKKKETGGEGKWVLSGRKEFVTQAAEAVILVVAASAGTGADGKKIIRMIAVDRYSPGVEINPMAELPFVPEISHGTVAFSDVCIPEDALLPGDGYDDYVKPFRTVEDLHVSAAVAGYLFRIASIHAKDRGIMEELAGLIVILRALAMENPSAPEVHIALSGAQQLFAAFLERAEPMWEKVDPVIRERWRRDRALLKIAGTAREKRREKAWSDMGIS